uniref:Uncharacterized protein n=1 Tax=Ananas comosus var. bracteatus TaxID=296719 RepID=A0A6V7PRI8_ANACO|nr:unnamed protein product [Ananas comosus var. bracteatus]
MNLRRGVRRPRGSGRSTQIESLRRNESVVAGFAGARPWSDTGGGGGAAAAPAGQAQRREPRSLLRDPAERIADDLLPARRSVGESSGVEDDDLFYVGVEKSNYDWLLTPHGTPLFSSCTGVERQPSSASAKSTSEVGSASATKPSRVWDLVYDPCNLVHGS